VTDSIRVRNLDVVNRFFANDRGDTRRRLYAPDAVFEMPFALNGAVTVRGRDAIIEEHEEAHADHASCEYFDLRVDPTLDPAVFWTTVRKRIVRKNGKLRLMELVNYLCIVDGLVVHRVEYFTPVSR
jgi:ketosteroid isomerase-like protein